MVNIIIPKPRIIVPGHMAMKGSYAAFIQIEKAKCDSEGNEIEGTRHIVAPWFKNTITDIGLNAKGTGWGLRCVLGTGASPITTSHTNLGNMVALFNSKVGDSYHNGSPYGLVTSSTPYYGWKRGTYRFDAGNGTGTLSEVGLTITSSGADYKIAMGSLIKDNLGNPTTITKNPDELLDISYEVRLYAKMTDDTYIVNINGTDHTFTTRAQVDSAGAWGNRIPEGTYPVGYYTDGNPTDVAYGDAALANIGTILQPLQGVTLLTYMYQGDGNSKTILAYVDGSLFREVNWQIGPANANHPNGITGFKTSTSVGDYKTVVSPAIPKTLGATLLLKARWYWDRYTM